MIYFVIRLYFMQKINKNKKLSNFIGNFAKIFKYMSEDTPLEYIIIITILTNILYKCFWMEKT